jgi:hypothetical protein
MPQDVEIATQIKSPPSQVHCGLENIPPFLLTVIGAVTVASVGAEPRLPPGSDGQRWEGPRRLESDGSTGVEKQVIMVSKQGSA